MTVQECLNLCRVDVLTATNHHVLAAPDDVDVTLCIHGGKVAGMHPMVTVNHRPLLGFVFPVAMHYPIAARAKLPRLSWRNRLPSRCVNDFYFEVRQYGTH